MDIWKSWDGNWKIGSPSARMEDGLIGCLVGIIVFLLIAAVMVAFKLVVLLLSVVFKYPKVGIPLVVGVILLFVFVPALGSIFRSPGPMSAAPPAAAAKPAVVAQPSPVVQSTATVVAKPTPVRTALAKTYWVKNHRKTGMWSASGDPGDDGKPAVKFGETSTQFCSLLVMLAQERGRLYVFNPYSNDYFWVDVDAVGPVSQPPERRAEGKPSGQNCAEAVYAGTNLPRGAPEPR
jgi:hypothetical protein